MSGPQPEARTVTSPEQPDAPPIDQEPRPRFGLWIVLNIAAVVFCAAWPTGIPGFVIALLSQSDWEGGDRLGARRKYKLAVMLGSISLIWGGLIFAGLLAVLVLATAQGSTGPLAPPSY